MSVSSISSRNDAVAAVNEISQNSTVQTANNSTVKTEQNSAQRTAQNLATLGTENIAQPSPQLDLYA